MKVTSEHVATLRAAIAPLDTDERREFYREGRFRNADKVQDVNRRYRWDLMWVASSGRHQNAVRNVLWYDEPEYNDAHIDTALRAIVPPL